MLDFPEEVIGVSSTTEQPGRWPVEEIPTDELAKRQGVEPIVSVDELAQPDLWESEQEYQDFLADLYATRQADIA
jgi:hypothetical protein